MPIEYEQFDNEWKNECTNERKHVNVSELRQCNNANRTQ